MNLKKSTLLNFLLSAITFLFISINSYSQNNSGQETTGINNINTITTSVPFLLISPDSRSGAMGDVGVAISPDANAVHWNPAKLVFIDPIKDVGFSMSYSPWLRALVNDINLAYLSGYKRLDRFSTIGASLRYFSLGNITFTDNVGSTIREFKPSEFSFDVVYSRKLSDNFSAGISARYINSNLTGGTPVAGAETKPGQSVATDLSLYYISNPFKIAEKNSTVAFGTNISNIGAKMSYTDGGVSDFIPTNLRIGSTISSEIDEFNKFSFSVDLNKLLVPTNPIYELDNGSVVYDASGNPVVLSGRSQFPEIGVASGIFGSFTDAPGIPIIDDNGSTIGIENGSKFKEELNEVNLSLGAEFLYSELFALRAGYFYEHPTKGNRRFISFGAGVKYKVLELDLSYIIANNQSPLANTIRFSIKLNMGGSEPKEE